LSSKIFVFYFHVFFFKRNKMWCKHDWVFIFFGFTTWNLVFWTPSPCKLDVQFYYNLINFKFPWVDKNNFALVFKGNEQDHNVHYVVH
jgi:hypothetical protein